MTFIVVAHASGACRLASPFPAARTEVRRPSQSHHRPIPTPHPVASAQPNHLTSQYLRSLPTCTLRSAPSGYQHTCQPQLQTCLDRNSGSSSSSSCLLSSPPASPFSSSPATITPTKVAAFALLAARALIVAAAASDAAAPSPSDEGSGGVADVDRSTATRVPEEEGSWWDKWKAKSQGMKDRLAKLGLSAVLAYGLFDDVTYTTFFVLAFLGYETSTGRNPAANLKALLGIVVLMWTGNNVTRPFRVAGAAACAPFLDRALNQLQQRLRLPSQLQAFALVVSVFASLCFSVVGLLILSRLRG